MWRDFAHARDKEETIPRKMYTKLSLSEDLVSLCASTRTAYVLFTAPWCPSLVALEQVVLAHPTSSFVVVDVDDHSELCADTLVNCIPALLVFRYGSVIDRTRCDDNGTLTAFVARHEKS